MKIGGRVKINPNILIVFFFILHYSALFLSTLSHSLERMFYRDRPLNPLLFIYPLDSVLSNLL